LYIRLSLTNFRKFPEPEVLTAELMKKGQTKDPFDAKVPLSFRWVRLTSLLESVTPHFPGYI
jgi:hypothetical protein